MRAKQCQLLGAFSITGNGSLTQQSKYNKQIIRLNKMGNALMLYVQLLTLLQFSHKPLKEQVSHDGDGEDSTASITTEIVEDLKM